MSRRRTGPATSVAPQLRAIRRKPAHEREDAYPFSVPSVRALDALAFPTPLTFFVGENGSGKSTLMEAIAAAARLPTAGPDDPQRSDAFAHARRLAAALTFEWGARSHRGFFLRAEDFFGFVRQVATMRQEARAQLAQIDTEYVHRSDHARTLASLPARSSLAALESRYGADFDANSHGEQFLMLFRERFVPGGLFLLDEPEAALSPQSQLALVAMLLSMVREGGQFVIATHSPIILACPGATIVSFDETPPAPVAYDSLAHVSLTRDFLNDPARYLRHLDA